MDACICLGCCCCCTFTGLVILSVIFGKVNLPSMFEFVFYTAKNMTIYGILLFSYIFLFSLILLAVNEMLKCIVSFKEDIQSIDKEKQYIQKRRQTIWILTIIFCNLALISLSVYLSFYFDSVYLKIPIIFYISYSLAVAASFPAKKTPSYKTNRSDRFSDHFKFKIILNFVLIVGCFVLREVYLYYKDQEK